MDIDFIYAFFVRRSNTFTKIIILVSLPTTFIVGRIFIFHEAFYKYFTDTGQINLNTSGRLEALWPPLVEKIKHLHILGYGWGAADDLIYEHTFGLSYSTHSQWLQLLYDTEVLGTLLFILVLLTSFKQLKKIEKLSTSLSPDTTILLKFLRVFVIVFMLQSFFDELFTFNLWYGAFGFMIIGVFQRSVFYKLLISKK